MGNIKFPFTRSRSRKGARNGSSQDALQSRSKNADHPLDFLDWVNGLGFEKTRLGTFFTGLEVRFKLRLMGGLFLFSLALSFLLFFDFDFSFSAKVGEQAARDIKSPISFDVRDDVATEEKRSVAEATVPTVFDFDRGAFNGVYGRVYQAFRRMREEARRVPWAGDDLDRDLQVRDFLRNKAEFDLTLQRTISEPVFEWLAEMLFSARIENVLIGALDRWASFRIVDGVEKNVPQGQTQVIVREVARGGTGREAVVGTRDLKDLAREDEFPVDRISGLDRLSPKEQRLVLQLARALLGANVTLNRQETETRRQRARDSVPPISLTVRKGQTIVAEGMVVTPAHARLFREIEAHRSHRHRDLIALVSAVMFMALILVCFSYLRRFSQNRVRVCATDLRIMGVVTILVVALSKIFIFILNASLASKYGAAIPEQAFMFAAPTAAGSMLVGLLIPAGEIVWIFSLFLGVVLGVMVDLKFTFAVVTIVAGIAAARGVHGCKARNDLYWAGLRTGLVSALMIALVITVMHFDEEGYARLLLWTVPAGLVSGILSSFVAMMLIPLLESAFNVTTDVKLLELSNLNHPLLKEMIVQAPGTYHHSLVVGSMVEAAAEEIGANSLLAKVMSYYHDIGKTEHAGYFIENQRPGHNPHDSLSPNMSKTVLIAHVKDGVELGLEHKLGQPIIDGIVQHHGTTLIAFFYNRALEGQNESIDSVREDDFRYPGPKPQFREAALIMLADSIEAASRSLDEPTPVRLQNIVKNIIQRKFMDGQLDECNLTLRDLSVIEASFIRVLLGIYHQRIDYPRRAGGGAGDAVEKALVNAASPRAQAKKPNPLKSTGKQGTA